MKNWLAALMMGIVCHPVAAQTIPAGMPVLEETGRRLQLHGQLNQDISFAVRPLQLTTLLTDSSAPNSDLFYLRDSTASIRFAKTKGLVRLQPLTLRQQFNSRYAYLSSDGAMIPAKGYQTLVSAGVYASLGPLSIQLQPEFLFAQNPKLANFPAGYNDTLWRTYYYTVANRVDAPEQFGKGAYARLFPGQSSIRFNFKKFSLGFSTENLWWGPGQRNALLMSNSAPGFPHLTFNTTAPIHSPIGSFEGQFLSGWLHKSGFLPADTSRRFNGQRLYDPKPANNRYLNGVILTWQPKWTKGLFLGFARTFYLYQNDIEASLDGYLPVIGSLFKGDESSAQNEDGRRRDQMLSLFFRLLLPKENAEIYGEFGRNDHSGNLPDLLMEPEHSRAYVIGLRKLFTKPGKAEIEVFAELCTLQMPNTINIREQESWYSHYQVRDGYTHLGQVIGASVGSGGSSQTIGVNYLKNNQKTGLLLERIVHNNDFYYEAFSSSGEYWRHWVDLSVQLNKSWRQKKFLYDARLGWMKSLSYQWQPDTNLQNFHLVLSVSYLF